MVHRPNLPEACFLNKNKVLLEHDHSHLFIYCLWLLSCYQYRVVSTEPYGPEKPKMFNWPFTENKN